MGEVSALCNILTPRQVDVAELVAAGFTDQEIGARLNVGSRTVAFHVQDIYRELKLSEPGRNSRVMLCRRVLGV